MKPRRKLLPHYFLSQCLSSFSFTFVLHPFPVLSSPPPPFFPVFFSPGPIANSQHPALGDDERPLPFVRAAGRECYEVFIDSRFMTSWGGTTRGKSNNLCIYIIFFYIAVP
eukprot:GHVU01055258.1.p1 GENE.GHVU01055258.1~~GHVU01055258.1.p1  ORF type:complete len:111 (-),score=2.19 GHVU01055258.1:117-449(-)